MRVEEETRDVGEKKLLRWKISCEKKDSFKSCVWSVILESFLVEETFALTRKYTLQERQKLKQQKNL